MCGLEEAIVSGSCGGTGQSGLALVAGEVRAGGVLERTQQTTLSSECRMKKAGRASVGGWVSRGAVSELEVTEQALGKFCISWPDH